MKTRYSKNLDKLLECGICHRMEPEVKIRTLNGKPRAHRMCEDCRNAYRRTERRMAVEVSNLAFDALCKINWDRLEKLPYDNYKLTFSLQDELKGYPGGVICIREDFVWVYTYEGVYQWPAPYEKHRIARHLAYLHLHVSKQKAEKLSSEEAAELANSGELTPLKVFGVC